MSDDSNKSGYGSSYFGAVLDAFIREAMAAVCEEDAGKARVVKAAKRELSATAEEAKRHEQRD